MPPRMPFHKGTLQKQVSEGSFFSAFEGWQLCIYCNTTKGYKPIIEMFCWIGWHICPPCGNINKTLDDREWYPLNIASKIISNHKNTHLLYIIQWTWSSIPAKFEDVIYYSKHIEWNTLFLHCMKLLLVRISANFKVFETCHRSVFTTLRNSCIINTKDYVNFVWCLFSLMFLLCFCSILACWTRFTVIWWFPCLRYFLKENDRNGYYSVDDCLRWMSMFPPHKKNMRT